MALFIGGGAYGRLGHWESAVRALEHGAEVTDRLPFYLGWLGWGYAGAGRKDDARVVLSELERRADTEYVSHCFRGGIHAALGEHDDAFDCFDRAVLEGEVLLSTPHLPFFAPVRDDPRFAELLIRTRFPRPPR